MPPLRKSQNSSLANLLEELSSGINLSVVRPSVNKYVPHSKQLIFHKSLKQGRLYIGGNRSGKTVGGIVEDIWWLTGKHPYVETPPPPVYGRIVTVDYENGWELIIKPTLLMWLPRSELINGSWEDSWSEKYKVLTLANGSKLDIMSYNQATEKQAGTSRDFVHFDEEPPSVLFKENKMRLLDREGRWWVTMTPVEGMSWTYDDIYLRGINNDPLIDVIQVRVEENPYISDLAIDAYLTGMDEQETRARREGEYVGIGGLILKTFDPAFHVIPEIKPDPRWEWVASLDHGYNNPTAWLYHAILPNGSIITFYEHYRREWTIKQHADEIHSINHRLGKSPNRYVGDPAIKQRLPNSGKSVHREYLEAGIPIQASNNDVRIGIDQLNYRLKAGKWFITENCRNLIWEMKRYRWKTRPTKKLQEKHGAYDEPLKKDDHAVDSSRYLMINHRISDIGSDLDNISRQRIRQQIVSMLNPGSPVNILVGKFDTGLSVPVTHSRYDETGGLNEDFGSINTEWTEVDDYLGGIY
jgi:phage terminase large subunit-like protein